MSQEVYNFTVVNNDTFSGAEIEILVNSVARDLTDATIKLQARKKGTNELVWKIDNGTVGGITITDATNGIFEIDEQIIEAEPGVFPYDIQITFSDDTVKTYIKGEITIERDYTE